MPETRDKTAGSALGQAAERAVQAAMKAGAAQADALLESARLLANSARLLADKVVDGAEADVARTREFAESSPSIVTPLNRYLGYEEAASIAKQSLQERKTIREVVLERGHVDDGALTLQQLDAALDVLAMTGAGKRG